MTEAVSQAPSGAPSGAFRLFEFAARFVMGVGVVFALFVILRLDPALELFMTLGFWPGAATETLSREALLAAGIAGGVLAGWGATLSALARHLGEAGLRLLSRPLLLAVILWFVLDGAASVVSGAPFNILLNLPYLLLLGGPLLAMRAR